jgi:hypothetical protein
MGFFDFLKPKPKVNVSITTHEPTKDEIAKQYTNYCKAQAEKRHAEQEERANDNFLALSADDLADKNGLKPTEILMLSYLEKYSSGKPVAKFWHYDYGVDDVWPIIKKLESMGFAENGKLTDKGKAELNDNEYVYFYHRKSYAHWAFTLPEFCRAVNDRKDIPYRDLIWGQYNKLYMEAFSSPKRCRDLRYLMYEFLADENKYKNAFSMLLEVPFYDMNCSHPFISPNIMLELKKAQKKAAFTEEDVFNMAKGSYSRIFVDNPTIPAMDAAGVVTSYIFGKDGLAQRVLKSYKIDCNRLFST